MSFQLQFPHISRQIPASIFPWGISLILWLGLGLLLGVNTYARLQAGNQITSPLSILIQPLSPKRHLEFAQMLWNEGYEREAKYEAAVADDLTQNGAVLGAETPTRILTQWNEIPKKLTTDLEHWQTIILQKPDYRDAYIQAGITAFRLKKKTEAITLIQRASAIDPTSIYLTQLLDQILATP